METGAVWAVSTPEAFHSAGNGFGSIPVGVEIIIPSDNSRCMPKLGSPLVFQLPIPQL